MTLKLYLNTSHGQIHARTAGISGPRLVLLHETPVSSSAIQPAMPSLSKSFQVLAPDTPGYGGSDPPSSPIEIPEYAARLLEAIRIHLDDEPFAIGGIHTGAAIAVEVALQSEGQSEHLVLMGLPAYDDATRMDRKRNWAPDIPVEASGDHLGKVWRRYEHTWSAENLHEHHESAVDVLRVLSRYNWAYDALFRYDPVPALQRYMGSVLFLSAENDPLTQFDRRVAALTGAQIIEIAGIPGQIPIRAAEELASILTKFISSESL